MADMASAITKLTATGAEVLDPRGTLLVVDGELPGAFHSNRSLNGLRLAASGNVQNLDVRYVFSNDKAVSQALAAVEKGDLELVEAILTNKSFLRSPAFLRLHEQTKGPDGECNVIVRGFDSEFNVIPNETDAQMMQRAVSDLRAPVVSAVVNGHTSLDSPGARGPKAASHTPLAQRIRAFVRDVDLRVVFAWPDASVSKAESWVKGTSIRSGLDIKATKLLQSGDYDQLVLPTVALTREVESLLNKHLDLTGGREYSAVMPMIGNDKSLNIATVPVPPAAIVRSGESMEHQHHASELVADALGIEPVVVKGADKSLSQGIGVNLPAPTSPQQSDFGLGA